MTPLLFLDIDGTVRHSVAELGRFVNHPDDVVVFPEALERMREWKNRGGRIIGVSNQGGIALGLVERGAVEAAMLRTHELCDELFDHLIYCAHHPDAEDPEYGTCWCRKPAPGLLYAGGFALHKKTSEQYPPHLGLMVGDRDEDQECARRANWPFMWAVDWRAGAEIDEAEDINEQ